MPTPDMTFITSESHPINILKFQQLFPSWEAKFLAPDPREAGIRLEWERKETVLTPPRDK